MKKIFNFASKLKQTKGHHKVQMNTHYLRMPLCDVYTRHTMLIYTQTHIDRCMIYNRSNVYLLLNGRIIIGCVEIVTSQ